MRKSFLQQIGESMPGFIYGMDLSELLIRQENEDDVQMKDEGRSPDRGMKALKEQNKHQ